MREYKYQAIVKFLDDGARIVIVQRAENMNSAREKVCALLADCGVISPELYEFVSIKRVNITEQRRSRRWESLAFVDLGQCAI